MSEWICQISAPPIDIICKTPDTLRSKPKNSGLSPHNKQNLQMLVEVIVHRYNKSILLSSLIIEDEPHPAKLFADGQVEEASALSDSWLEEADKGLIIHVEWAVEEKQCERVIVVSNNTDTLSLLLYHLPYLKNKHLKELWQQFWTGKKKQLFLFMISPKIWVNLSLK